METLREKIILLLMDNDVNESGSENYIDTAKKILALTSGNKEYILCSAIYYDDGKEHVHQPKNITIGIVVAGRRHHNCITTLSSLIGADYDKKLAGRDGQGFITNTDRFVSRKEAYVIAKEAGQLLHNMHDKTNLILVSEDLW